MATLVEQWQALAAELDVRPECEADLRKVRLQLARAWADADEAQAARMARTELRTACRVVRGAELRNYRLQPDEVKACRPWIARLRDGWPSPSLGGTLLACSLFLPMHELALRPTWEGVPSWLVTDYLQYLFEPPALLLTPGESARYAHHLQAALTALEPVLDELGDDVEEWIVRRLNVMQAYFHDGSLRELMAARGRLLEHYLRRRGFTPGQPIAGRKRNRPRVGVLAPAYAPQPEGYFAIANLEALNRTGLELYVYAFYDEPNPVSQACRKHADHFIVLPSDLPGQVARVRADALDLLLVMTNVGALTSQMTLLCAHRLAPVQVASMATPVSTGLSQIDWFLSSELNDADDAQPQYTEKVCRVAGGINHYVVFDEPAGAPLPTRAALGIAEDAVVYFSALNFFKIVPELAADWAAVLAAVPESVLVLLPFGPSWSEAYPERAFLRRLEQDLVTHGADPARCHVLAPVPTRGDVSALMRLADVYLDGYPFAGACSIYDPLMVALPTVAREGQSARTRHGANILRMFGMDELVTHSSEAYIRLAVDLGLDRGRRADVAARLAESVARANPVRDSNSLGRRLGPALEALMGSAP